MVQAALLYTPQLRPNPIAEKALEDELIMAASYPDATPEPDQAYVLVDWGPVFIHAHALALPRLKNACLVMCLGALAAEYVANRRGSAYLPARAVKRRLDAGTLHVVADAPRFPYPAWIVWRDDIDPDIAATARTSLAAFVADAESEQKTLVRSLDAMTGHDAG